MIGGIVMAAGLSQRMRGSTPKQLLPLDGKPLVAVTTAAAVASRLDLVVVVTGHHGAEIAAAVGETGATTVANPNYRQGNMTSFLAAYEVMPQCDAYLILLADMPGVSTEIIDRMVSAWNATQPWAAVARYADGRRHPLLLSAAAMSQAVGATGSKAVWRLLEQASKGTVEFVDFAIPAPIDVNTQADYEAVVASRAADLAE